MRQTLQSVPLAGHEPEIGRWLWALEEVRQRTLDSVEGLDPWTLDWEGPNGDENAIGSLLYNIAVVEMSWLFMDILERGFPTEVADKLPHPMATDERITRVGSLPLEKHVWRLTHSRTLFLEALRGMSLEEWHRLRSPKDTPYEVTPAWVVFHLMEHEAGHASQIRSLKVRAERQ